MISSFLGFSSGAETSWMTAAVMHCSSACSWDQAPAVLLLGYLPVSERREDAAQ